MQKLTKHLEGSQYHLKSKSVLLIHKLEDALYCMAGSLSQFFLLVIARRCNTIYPIPVELQVFWIYSETSASEYICCLHIMGVSYYSSALQDLQNIFSNIVRLKWDMIHNQNVWCWQFCFIISTVMAYYYSSLNFLAKELNSLIQSST